MRDTKHAAVVLAAGRGSRMQSETPKQYMELLGKPVIYYALKVFEESFVDEIVLVTGDGQQDYCRREIVEKYGFCKVSGIVAGGAQRCDSVRRGLEELSDADYVFIHDGARPLVSREILERGRECVLRCDACAAGMPVKDTIKIVDDGLFVKETPQRSQVWAIQTPQVFSYPLIRKAYDIYHMEENRTPVTDDAMVVESMLEKPVKLFEGAYENMKITTPEDLLIAEEFLKKCEIYY